jgi:branched-chain amino acid transport system ATP-binding protein
VITGALAPTGGDVLFEGRSIKGLRPNETAQLGIGRTFQIVRPFPGLTTLENVAVAALARERTRRAATRRAHEILEVTHLAPFARIEARNLTLARRKRLEVARAIALRPRLILLDEVMAGLRPTETDEMVAVFRELNRSGLTILLIEHVMRAVMALAGEIVVLHHGQVISRGAPEAVVRDPAVLESYLGEADAAGEDVA